MLIFCEGASVKNNGEGVLYPWSPSRPKPQTIQLSCYVASCFHLSKNPQKGTSIASKKKRENTKNFISSFAAGWLAAVRTKICRKNFRKKTCSHRSLLLFDCDNNASLRVHAAESFTVRSMSVSFFQLRYCFDTKLTI